MLILLVSLLAATVIIVGAKESKGICDDGGTLGFLARVAAASVAASLVCLALLERVLQPVLAHHALDSSNTLLHLVTHLLVARVSVP